MLRRFRDRFEAGRELAKKLIEFAANPDVLVLALPRGGVPTAFEVAQALQAPLDVFMVRKLEDFSETTDDQVRDLLERAGAGTIAATAER